MSGFLKFSTTIVVGAIITVALNFFHPEITSFIFSWKKDVTRQANKTGNSYFYEARKHYKIAEEKFQAYGNLGAKHEIEKSLALFERAFKNGVDESAYYLAVIHTGLKDVNPKRVDLCLYWMKKAIEIKDPNANFGLCH